MPDCPICFKKANYTTACNHKFCKKCLYQWKNTCPLCRRNIDLVYPNTRAMASKQSVMDEAIILLENIKKADEIYKLQLEKILLNHIWDNRIIIRKNGHLCKLVHRTALRMLKIYDHMGILPPKILLKTATM